MGAFILRRLVFSIPVLIGILIVTFALGRLIPGDPCKAMLGEKANADVCASFIQRYGLDQPIPQQFATYVGNVVRGDLGDSIRFGQPVTTLLTDRLPDRSRDRPTALRRSAAFLSPRRDNLRA